MRPTTVALLSLLSACASGPDADVVEESSPAADSSSSAATDVAEDSTTAAVDGPTFYEDIAPILAETCVRCHADGGIAPFSLVDYEDAATWAAAIVASTHARTMPPINADASGACNEFVGLRWLTDDELSLVSQWQATGAQSGDPANAPAAPGPELGLAEPDRVLDTGVEYTPVGTDDYRCFVVDPELEVDTFMTAYQVLPGNKSVSHHLILFGIDSEAGEQLIAQLDADDPGPGYSCFGGPGTDETRFLAGWAPGLGITRMPAGSGVRMPAGRSVVMQMHYNTAAGVGSDRTTIALELAEVVDRQGQFVPIASREFSLAPELALAETSFTGPVPGTGEIEIWGVGPHMHTRGRTMRVTAATTDGEACLLDVPSWDFSWQSAYFYREPVVLHGGDMVTLSCGFDTRGATGNTTWGESTADEMCLNYLYVVQ